MNDNNYNSVSPIGALRDYVKDLRKEVWELRELVTNLRISQAVTKVKLAIYVGVVVIVVSLMTTFGSNLLIGWLKTKF